MAVWLCREWVLAALRKATAVKLLTLWAKCLALVVFVPTLFFLIPAAAAVDCVLDRTPYVERVARYYKLLSRLEVEIKSNW